VNPDRPWETPEAEWRADVARVRAGRPLMPDAWPDGARCALALSFDCDHETFEMGAGRAAIGRLAWGEYGRRRGVPRILATLARHDVRATFFVPAVAGLIEPDALAPSSRRDTRSASTAGSTRTLRSSTARRSAS
jgi:peptidoglycan-N-acetylglucosamine deacetylase